MTSITPSRSPSPASLSSNSSLISDFFNHHIIQFEAFPPEIRNKVYGHLLIKPHEDDDTEYDDEETRITATFESEIIDPIHEPGSYDLHPAILRTSKKIHAEAAAVLWGENYFTWYIDGKDFTPLWHRKPIFHDDDNDDTTTRKISPRYSRLITKMHLCVTAKGDSSDPYQTDTIYMTTKSLTHACKKLSLNNFKVLKVDFFNPLNRRQGRDRAQVFLEALKKVRANKV